LITPDQVKALTDLHRLMQTDPERLKKLLIEKPEIARLLLELNEKYSAGKSVTVKGFLTFYKSVYLRDLPEAAQPLVELCVGV
jgi:tmRNA-binding protein